MKNINSNTIFLIACAWIALFLFDSFFGFAHDSLVVVSFVVIPALSFMYFYLKAKECPNIVEVMNMNKLIAALLALETPVLFVVATIVNVFAKVGHSLNIAGTTDMFASGIGIVVFMGIGVMWFVALLMNITKVFIGKKDRMPVVTLLQSLLLLLASVAPYVAVVFQLGRSKVGI